jgi:C1A family cysteine protease
MKNSQQKGFVTSLFIITVLSILFFSFSSKILFAQTVNICRAYEVCNGQIDSSNISNRACMGTCELPKTFDWRNRHGENWNTSVKNQGVRGSCYAFGPISAFEANINLYFNQHLNVDLAEMTGVSCSKEVHQYTEDGSSLGCDSLYNSSLCNAKAVGFPEEACLPYDGSSNTNVPVCNICTKYKDGLWKISDFGQLVSAFVLRFYTPELATKTNTELFTEDKLKEVIMTNGPVAVFYDSWNHTMSIVGWTYESGKLLWIVKNSWGDNWMDKGYGKIETLGQINNNGQIERIKEMGIIYVKGPIIPPAGSNYQISCADKDDDGFFNWGISKTKPLTCPSYAKNEEDWDDSDPKIGALGLQTSNGSNPNNPVTPSSMKVIYPNGGETLVIGKSYTTKWWDDRDAGNVTIFAVNSTTGKILPAILGSTFIRSSGIDGTYAYLWKVGTNLTPGSYKLMVCKADTSDCDTSDNFFTITSPDTTQPSTIVLNPTSIPDASIPPTLSKNVQKSFMSIVLNFFRTIFGLNTNR